MLLWLKRYDHKASGTDFVITTTAEQTRPSNPMLVHAGRMMVRMFPFLLVLGL